MEQAEKKITIRLTPLEVSSIIVSLNGERKLCAENGYFATANLVDRLIAKFEKARRKK